MTERRYTKEAFDADPEWFEQVVCEDMAEEIVHRTEWLVECRAEVQRLREENEALWAFVKAVDAIGNAITTVDRDRALDAAEAATEARAALNDLRGNR